MILLSMSRSLLLVSALLVGMVSLAAAPAQWAHLGTRTVNHQADRDQIQVTAREGSFRSIKLKIRRAPVTMQRVYVHYANGRIQEVALRQAFDAGDESRVIDLVGRHRVIEKVVFQYRTSTRWWPRKAAVDLYGIR